MYLGKSKETLDITMGGIEGASSTKDIQVTNEGKEPKKPSNAKENDLKSGGTRIVATGDSTNDSKPAIPEQTPPIREPDTNQRPATASGWLGGWLSRPNLQDGTGKLAKPPSSSETVKENEGEVAKDIPTPQEEPVDEVQPSSSAPASSWFGLWYPATPAETTETVPVKIPDSNKDTIMGDAPGPPAASAPTSSSWAFWSSDIRAKLDTDGASEVGQVGQVAVSGEPSQNSPEPAKISRPTEPKKKKSSKRIRHHSTDIDESSRPEQSTVDTPAQSSTASKTQPPNLLMPSVKQTFRLVENPSILQQIARLLLLSQQPPAKHVYLAKDPPVIKKALAIGIHGLFPAPLLRTVIGQPTGTSIRFANHAATAIRRWSDAHGCKDCEIEKVALEGEGKIADRVDNLWKLLLNWIDHVRKADFILVACHSQGVPVAIMLVAKLIEFGVVSQGRIGICAMGELSISFSLPRKLEFRMIWILKKPTNVYSLAGVSLGPFADYKSRFISGSAGEIFEFADPESVISKRLEDSLRVAVKYGARITYVGSIDDQLVSMEVCYSFQRSLPFR